MRTFFFACVLALGCDAKQDLGNNGACREGFTDCGGACADLFNDPDHCGACGTACAANQVCAFGQCMASCPQPLATCGRSCASLGGDDLNCGACGNACPDGQHCGNAQCFTCPANTHYCVTVVQPAPFGACADFSVDNNNCGKCGVRCNSAQGQTCKNGVCM